MEEKILCIKEIAEMLNKNEVTVRQYLSRAEFNPFRFKKGLKTFYKVSPQILDRLKELIYNRRCGYRFIG